MELSLSLLPLLVAISSQHKTDSPLKKSPCFSRERYSMLRVFLYTFMGVVTFISVFSHRAYRRGRS